MSTVNCKTKTLKDGTLAELCSCGCPSIPDVLVSHALLRDAARNRWTTAEVIAKLPPNTKRAADMIRSATNALVRDRLMEHSEVTW